jgi:hypothetical protein
MTKRDVMRLTAGHSFGREPYELGPGIRRDERRLVPSEHVVL